MFPGNVLRHIKAVFVADLVSGQRQQTGQNYRACCMKMGTASARPPFLLFAIHDPTSCASGRAARTAGYAQAGGNQRECARDRDEHGRRAWAPIVWNIGNRVKLRQ